MKSRLGRMCVALALVLACSAAQAARNYSNTQTSPTPAPGLFDMGTTQSLVFSMSNTSDGTNIGERIYELRYRLSGACTGTPCTATVFSSSTAAPAGWTRTAFSSTSITFRANTWAAAIIVGTPQSFTLALTAGTSTQDRSETLLDVRASYTASTTYPTSFTRTARITKSDAANRGSWTLKSLQITSFQTTTTAGIPTSAIAAGTSFWIVITVKNISTITQNGIVANPSPPTATKTGTWTPGTWPSCSLTGTSPSPLNLASGASGTITYTCTTAAANSGTVYFSVIDVRSSTSITSSSGVSNTLSVSPLVVSIVPTPGCIFSGDTATFVMTVINNTGSLLSNVTPSALNRVVTGTVIIGTFSGPTPASVASLANGASTTFTWTAPITGTVLASGAKPTFSVTGTASANSGAIVSPLATSNPIIDLDEYLVGVNATTPANAASTNAELSWTVTSRGCNSVRQVEILLPVSGWTYNGDAYSLVTNTTGVQVETWTVSSATFISPNATDNLGLNNGGSFNLVFSATPSAAGTSSFTVRITDSFGTVYDRATSIPVNAYGNAGGNDALRGVWREEFQ